MLNAILCTAVEPDRLVDARQAPRPHAAVPRPADHASADRLRCAYDDGTEPYVIHQFVRKPWLEPMYHGIYSQLLSRLWLGARRAR